jgi:AraC-like DNA-binding protein
MKSTIEIILKDDVQRIFDAFSSCFNIRIGFLSPEGKILAVGLEKPCNDFCTHIREALNKKDRCLALDKEKMQEALIKKDMITWRCYAGMIESIMPLYYEGVHLGFFMLGRYRDGNKINRRLLNEYEKKFGSAQDLIIAYLKTPSFSPQQIQDMQNFFRLVVNYIVFQNLIVLKSNLVVEKIIDYAKSNKNKNLSIKEAANIAGRSVSTVSHLFSNLLQKSFKQVMTELKVEQAERYFKEDPDITIKEVAAVLGFDDPYYFSRMYKKVRGFAPSKYREAAILS